MPIPELRQQLAKRRAEVIELRAMKESGTLPKGMRLGPCEWGLFMTQNRLTALEWELHIRARDEEFLKSCSIAPDF